MVRSSNLAESPHMAPNNEPPQPGDVVFGDDGLFCVSVVTPVAAHGLLVYGGGHSIVEVALEEYPRSFSTKILMRESIEEMNPGSRVQ